MGMIFYYRYGATDQFFNIPEEFFFFRIAEGQGDAAGAGPARSANTMYVCFGYIG